MSNLSLSFSFYFWWINSSQSVTLTNSLTQSVSVMPNISFLWGCNKVNYDDAATSGWSSSSSQWTMVSPDILESGGMLQANKTSPTHTYYAYGGATLTKVDVTNLTKIQFMLSSQKTSGSNNAYLDIGLYPNKVISYDATIQQRIITAASPNPLQMDVYEVDVSSLSGEYYIGWGYSISECSATISIRAIVGE